MTAKMGLPDWDGNGEKTILLISGIMCLGFIPIYIIRSLNQHGWKRCRAFFEKRGWLKPRETDEEKKGQQHQPATAPKPLQSAIPAILRKIERAYKAPAHITANNHPLDWGSPSRGLEVGWDPIRTHRQLSNRDSGASWDTVRSYHAVSLAHPVPPTPPNTGTFNSARSSWMSGGFSIPGADSAITPPNGAASHNSGGPSHSHGKRASINSVSTLRGLVIPEHLIKETFDYDEGDIDTIPYPMPAYIKTKITDGNYDHATRRNAMDHGKGTGIGVWLEAVNTEGPVSGNNSGSSPPPPPPSMESVPKVKETFPALSVPSQAVSTSSFTPNSTP